MAEVSWEFAVDTGGDGSFAADISADVLRAEWELGFGRPYEHIARPARAVLSLDNSAGRYSPEGGAALSGFDAGRALRIRSTYNSVQRQHAVLWIRRVEPEAGRYGSRRARVVCEGFLARAQRYPVEVPLQLGRRGDEIIAALLDASGLYPPGFTGYWLLGVAAHGEVGQKTRLGDVSTYSDFEPGISTFPYAMDNNRRGSSLYAALRLVAESEQGRVLVDRTGRVVFWNRHHLAKQNVPAGTFDDSMFGLEYRFGAGVVNRCTVRFRPRLLETAGPYVLGRLEHALRLGRNESREVRIRFEDGSGARISSTSLIQPVPYIDYTAHKRADGSGGDKTANFSVTEFEALAQSARVVFRNSGKPAYLDAGAQVRGYDRLTDFGQVEVSYQDEASIAVYGRQALVVNARLLEDPVVAESLARWLVEQRKGARGEALRVSFRPRRSEALMSAALGRTLGERVRVREAQTGLDADFFIVGERHQLRAGGMEYSVTWTLEPAGTQAFWLLGTAGYGEVGQATRLGY